jgi:riboflavin synthase
MFTGLIEEVGSVIAVGASKNGNQLKIAAPRVAKKIRRGESLAVNGCCLTLSSQRGEELVFDLLDETIARTNLKNLRRKQPVNLERAVAGTERFGGHFVQGHIEFFRKGSSRGLFLTRKRILIWTGSKWAIR